MNPTAAKCSHTKHNQFASAINHRSEHISSEISLKRTETLMQRPWAQCLHIDRGCWCDRQPEASSISEGAHKNNKQQPEAVVAMPRTCTDHYALLLAYSPVLEHWGRWFERTEVNTKRKTGGNERKW